MIHLVGLPHTQFNAELYSSCAFTAKAVRTVRMLRDAEREVTVYWGGDEADVSLLTVDEQREHFGVWDASALPVVQWDAQLPYWQQFNARAIAQIAQRIRPRDVVAVVGGSISQSVIDRFQGECYIVEPGVGYEGLARGTFCCFESYAWMHSRYGAYGIGDGRAFDTVIPNAVEPEEWSMGDSKGYALFVGRLLARKGPHVAAQIATQAGLPLVLAGAGVATVEPGRIVATDGTEVVGDVTHVGAVCGAARRELFTHAEVLICPTLYVGPWEGVHAEAMMSGVGVVAPDYGVFTETLPRQYRYRSMGDAVRAVGLARATRGMEWREAAHSLCGVARCTQLYDDWFDRIDSLSDGRGGWYSLA